MDAIIAEEAVDTRDVPGSSAEKLNKASLNTIADAFRTLIQ
ncbi:Isochorismatase hydrolase [Colletotrichum higginsianum IMI 349063]|uniref:Isochorismatase hydrolase n=1 Tax=Colletotrichum higginsianum (strain IMI 349063) TaxID=759273 RepID=A0A1B7XR23_COLHI|nr:Isochorismatase hydrolase [Colletotrichum higginsianum IMI 349063]OBR02222.1 Isochorismatase hydrolase [Colletotrichum higginsianum IMI 349063]